MVEGCGIWEWSAHLKFLLLLAEDAVTAWFDDSYLVVHFFTEVTVRDYGFFADADLRQVAVVGFTIQAPAVDVGGVYLDPVGAAVECAFFGEAAGFGWCREID